MNKKVEIDKYNKQIQYLHGDITLVTNSMKSLKLDTELEE